jgi:glycosyltransferase involved in cell wall biosynthesis
MRNAGCVAIICIAYNHEQWIETTLDSVRSQDYPDIQLLVVDNGSTDHTAEKIRNWVTRSAGSLSLSTRYLSESKPYCQLFNQILATVDCPYVIDLSGDDVLYPNHLSASVDTLMSRPGAAFSFSDANLTDSEGFVRPYYMRGQARGFTHVPDINNLYVTLIRRSCISSPTVVFDAAILKKEGGYDETLYYEDFDILIRLARKYPAVFSDHEGVLKRQHARSMSAAQYLPYRSQMLPSTVRVCQKIRRMNTSLEEDQALGVRILYELKHALWSANLPPARDLVELGKSLGLRSPIFRIYCFWAKLGWDISWLYLKLT